MLAALPAGFQESTFVSELAVPTDMVFAPDGRLFVTEKSGRVRVVENGVLLPTPFLTVAPDTEGDRGLVGIAFDPQYDVNGYVYIYYTRAEGGLANRLSRFTVSNFDENLADPNSEVVLLDDIPIIAIHTGGGMGFGPDGMLYLATGDGSDPSAAQDLGSLAGKLLRLDVNNHPNIVPADNPFVGQPSVREEIYAYGLRNPFKLDVNDETGSIWITNTGEDQFEEIHEAEPGANYGWPITEGATGIPGLTDPVYAYPHVPVVGGAITAGEFYSGTNFPVEYEGDFFFSDFSLQVIRRVDIHEHTHGPGEEHEFEVSDFATGLFAPTDIETGPDGALYSLDVFLGTVTRIEYVGSGNRSPNAVATASPQVGDSPMFVQFDASLSSDPDNDPLFYTWDFGDGSPPAFGVNVSHVYQTSGIYFATVTADDGNGGIDVSDPVTIAVDETPPFGQIQLFPQNPLYHGGDTVAFSGTAFDAEDGALPASAYSWAVHFHHNTHVHPVMGPIVGTTSSSFVIPTVGEKSTNVWYRVSLTVTDSSGLQHTSTADIFPQIVTVTLDTNVAGLSLELDGQTGPAPIVFNGVTGIERSVAAPLLQDMGGTTYIFDSWSNGGDLEHTLSTPTISSTITANYVQLDSASVTAAYFVAGAYEEILDRSAEPAGLLFHTDQLMNGVPRSEIVRTLWESDEHHAIEIVEMYDAYLDRIPTPSEVAVWVAAMQTGIDEIEVARTILSSPEFVSLLLLQPPVYVDALYNLVLERPGLPQEIQFFTDLLNSGVAHYDVAYVFLTSPERYNIVLDDYYLEFLDRPMAPAEAVGDLFASSISPIIDVATSVLGSAEFQTRQAAQPVVRSLYDNLLRRLPAQVEIDFWTQQLVSGAVREDVVTAFDQSVERLNRFIVEQYSLFLLRVPDAAEQNFWVNSILGGATENDFLVALLASPEYAALYPADGSFVSQLYEHILGRTADSAGLNGWVATLAGGSSRADVARIFLTTTEYRTGIITSTYEEFLGRGPDAGETAFWLATLPVDGSVRGELLRLLMASEEYYQVARPVSIAGSAGTLAEHEAFVVGLYDDLLGRTATTQEIASWIDQLSAGTSRYLVARSFWLSPEHGTRVAQEVYGDLLGRQPTAQEIADAISQLAVGEDIVDVTFSVLASAEYSALHVTDTDFVTALYADLLNRSPDTAELQFWLGQLAGGASRATVVATMQDSTEAWNVLVDAAYEDYLLRDPTQDDLTNWEAILSQGYEGPRGLAWSLLGMDEYVELQSL